MSIASEGALEEFGVLAKTIDSLVAVSAIEINISCPNVSGKGRCKLVSQDPLQAASAVKIARQATSKPIITKLSPNVTDIAEIAQAVEAAGSDAVSLINTLPGMAVDIATRRPKLANVFGGLSGPAVRPVALRMTWEVFQKIKIPIVAMGGIMDWRDAVEFIICGASVVCAGTVNFVDPSAPADILHGIDAYMKENKIARLADLRGSVRL
jgi:dihydroorotate dehydrogenase (NAD+) catalytic subunit